MKITHRYTKFQEQAMIAAAESSTNHALRAVELCDLRGPLPHLSDSCLRRCELSSQHASALGIYRSELRSCLIPETSVLRLNAVESILDSGVAQNVSIHDSFFANCQILNWDFRASSFEHVMFRDCLFTGSDFAWSRFKACSFENHKFGPLGLQGAHLEFRQCLFIGCELSEYIATETASFIGCHFINCSIQPDHRRTLEQGACSVVDWVCSGAVTAPIVEPVHQASPPAASSAPSERVSRYSALESMQEAKG